MGKSTVDAGATILTLDDLRTAAEERTPNFEALGIVFRSVLWLTADERAAFEGLLDGQKGDNPLEAEDLTLKILLLVADDTDAAAEVLDGVGFAMLNTLLEMYFEATQVGEV